MNKLVEDSRYEIKISKLPLLVDKSRFQSKNEVFVEGCTYQQECKFVKNVRVTGGTNLIDSDKNS